MARNTRDAGHRHVVIVVDDDVNVRRLFADALHSVDMDVHLAASGEQAIGVATNNPDACVVLADVRMPRMDGWDLQRLLRRAFPDLPVVLLTADHLLSIRGSVRDKPVSTADIEALVRTSCLANEAAAQG
ncbi:MAG TPA: response regulator [Candidatus Limnocylindria bacterium]|nr:response regulator [Candidatus Limnocylindria bacterium]